ncbi:PREDICTED: uncharacterized protein LOC109216680 [Nicotiana attenuata]|uniref:uncharacterized protein LOC109216680 n=1 Tax=Nicotiana attenuata TaxID=49451 RepID=UPI000904D78C|nr:PREDICTED: uncharacterized protein LOC109216680 [Nicotiana attenuata]
MRSSLRSHNLYASRRMDRKLNLKVAEGRKYDAKCDRISTMRTANHECDEGLETREDMSDYEEDMDENPFADIDEYIEDTNAIVPPIVGASTFKVEHEQCLDDALRLRVFKYSLAGDARRWLQNLPPNSIRSWPELVRAFLAKWFPQSKKSELWDKILFFKQQPGEHLHEAWDRFKLYLVRSPNHGFPDTILLEKFYMGLDPMNQSIAKNAADRSFMDKSFARVTKILDKMAKHNQAWYSEDTTGGIAYDSPSLTNLIKENQERDQIIAGLATNVNVLTKMFTESQTKKVNVVEDVQPTSNEDFEEANYINNSQGGYQRQQYQGQGHQNQWRPNPQGQGNQQWRNVQGLSSDSKLESMLERVLQNQEKYDTSMRNMTEIVGSHTASI